MVVSMSTKAGLCRGPPVRRSPAWRGYVPVHTGGGQAAREPKADPAFALRARTRLSAKAAAVSESPFAFKSGFDKEIFQVAAPSLLSMLLEPIMGAISSALVGQLGTQQLGAVSVGTLAISFCTFLFSFVLFLTTPEVAAAAVKGDKDRVSKTAAKGFWVSGFLGFIMATCVYLFAENIVSIMKPPEPAVFEYAVQYIRLRAPSILAIMLSFVATGTYRGFKDTRTPLYAAIASGFTSLVLNCLFIYGFGWGVAGSGLATSLASMVSCSALCGLLVRKGVLKLQDLLKPPELSAVLPMLRAGSVLAFRNVISFGMVLYASTLCVRAGSTYQASFEVIRQIWVLSIQTFESLNVCTQSLCAAYLGAGNIAAARFIMMRLAFLGVLVGAGTGAVVYAAQTPLINFFTRDPAVMNQVLVTLPLVALLFPLDALASIMDGSLLAAKQTDYLSFVQIGGAVVQYAALSVLASNSMVTTLSIWCCLKLLSLFRVMGGAYRNLGANSAYLVPYPPPPPSEGTFYKPLAPA